MPTVVNAEALMTLCSAIAASGFEVSNRIKSIAQVAHEYLDTSSIIIYAHNRVTGQLDVIAMPGVTQRELMRGPTDKIIFWWERPTSDAGRNGVWLEDDEEFNAYIKQLATKCNWPPEKVTQGNFRKRERDKHSSDHEGHGQLATAKIYMWKGLEQTGDKVGQSFFNFFVTEREKPVFTPSLRRLIHFVSDTIRELLIDRIYHENMPTVRWTPEYLLRELNTAFDFGPQTMNRLVSVEVEHRIANIIREAALNATENYGGYADLILLLGRRLGRIFDGSPAPEKIRAIIVRPDTITDTCIEERKYFVGNDVKFYDNTLQDRAATKVATDSRAWPPEIESAVCKSLMVVPVVHEDEVRAVIRLTSPRVGCFLDAQARAMRTLENLARYGILRLDQYRQREQMSLALDFYTSRMSIPGSADPSFLMEGVLSAIGAEWGTFWPIDRMSEDGTACISHGIKFEKDSSKSVVPDDQQVGIRGIGAKSEIGFSQTLVRLNACNPGDIFFVIHICLPEQMRYRLGLQSDYYLQVFSRTKPPAIDARMLPDEFYCYSVTDQDRLPESPKINLNPNTPNETHTRVAFVVSDQQRPIAIVWLKFPGLHEIAWWERRYIVGLSNSFGKLLQVGALEFAIHSFRHMVPGQSTEAEDTVKNLKIKYLKADETDTETKEAFENLEAYTLTMVLKSAEAKALLANTEGSNTGDRGYREFGERSLKEYVDKAIAVAVDFNPDRTPWKIKFGAGVSNETKISGVFYSVLLNLLDNIVAHAWDYDPPGNIPSERRLACIWITKRGSMYHTCVGNTGKPVNRSDLELASDISRKDHGAGLRVARAILQVYGGDLKYVPKEEYLSNSPDAPIELKECDTFFEFFMPIQKLI